MRFKTSPETIEDLKNCAAQIRQALADLDEAEVQLTRAGQKLTAEEQAAAREWADLDPLDDKILTAAATRRARLDLLRQWFHSSGHINAAVRELCAVTIAAARPISEAAQNRHPEETAIALCSWSDVFSTQPIIAENAQLFRRIASEVIQDITTLLAGQRGIVIGQSERQSQVIDLGPGSLRRLTYEELLVGQAFE